jgi:hypothetical protein
MHAKHAEVDFEIPGLKFNNHTSPARWSGFFDLFKLVSSQESNLPKLLTGCMLTVHKQ